MVYSSKHNYSIYKTYNTSFNSKEEMYFPSSVCFTYLMEIAYDKGYYIIERIPFQDLNNRGKYILKCNKENYTFEELKYKLDSKFKDLENKNKLWLLKL